MSRYKKVTLKTFYTEMHIIIGVVYPDVSSINENSVLDYRLILNMSQCKYLK